MRSSNPYLNQFIYSLIYIIPFALVCLIGIFLSIYFRERLGRSAYYSLFAFFLLLITCAVKIGLFAWVYLWVYPGGDYGLASFSQIIDMAVTIPLSMVGYILLLVAIFAKRFNDLKNEPPLPYEPLN